MKKALLSLVFAAVAIAWLPCEPGSGLVPAGDDAYDLLEALAFSAGIVPLSADQPRSEKSLMSELDAVPTGDEKTDDAITRALSDRFASRTLLEKPACAYRIAVTLTPEFYYDDVASTIPYYRGYGDRASILSIPIDVDFAKAFAVGGLIDLRQNPDAENKAYNPRNYVNVPANLGYFDFRIPLRSYVAASGDFWNLRLCRERVNWGASRNAIFLADTAGFLDHAYGEISLPDFSYGLLVASLDSRQEGMKNVSEGGTYNDVPRTFLAHRIQARFFKKIRVALSEGTMVGGVNPDLRYLNPFFIFHDSFSFDHATSYMGVELEAVPWKYFSVYANGAANQLQSSYETSTYPTAASVPNAFAWQVGSKGYLPMGPGFWDGSLEFSYVNPWMYIRETPATSYSNEHYLGSNVPETTGYDFPCLGFESGPDSILAEFRLGYRIPKTMEADLVGRYLVKGEQDLSTAYAESEAAASLVTPTGTPEKKLTVAAEGSWWALPWMKLAASLAFIHRDNAAHVLGAADNDVQCSFSLGIDAISLAAFIREKIKPKP
jgi:hypothetical protein